MIASKFDSLVSDLYRAATGAIEWESALEAVREVFQARFAVLQTVDFASGRLLSLRCGGNDPRNCLLDYLRTYHPMDPRRDRTIQLGATGFGTWRHCDEHIDEAFVASSSFYQDFSLAYDVRFGSHVVFPLEGSVGTGFALELAAARGSLTEDERELARRIGEHMRDALLAHHRVRTLMAQALAGHTLLNTFPYPMWLVDSERFVLFENPAGRAEAAAEELVSLTGGRLTLRSSRSDRKLTERLQGLAGAGHGASTVLDMRVKSTDEPVWLHLALLVPGAVLGAFGEKPQVLATLFDPAQIGALDTFALGNMFGFTPAEARVASRLAGGMTAEQIGQLHHTAQATVRTQARAVMRKLGAQRTVDVVRILQQGHPLWAGQG